MMTFQNFNPIIVLFLTSQGLLIKDIPNPDFNPIIVLFLTDRRIHII